MADKMTTVVVTLRVEGLHCWPEAAKYSDQVKFLADKHRHMFHIKCEAIVTHSDRDIEIIMFKRKVTEYLRMQYFEHRSNQHDFGRMSCEMIADELLTKYDLLMCEVLEDGENGAAVYNY